MCEQCTQKFSSKADLKKHMAAKHEEERQSFVCEACGKAYASASKLKNHIAYEHLNKVKSIKTSVSDQVLHKR